MRHLLKPTRIPPLVEQKLVIKTASRTKRPSNPRPSTRPTGFVYEVAKGVLQYYGVYEEFKQYDPGYYIEKYQKRYSYKPRKRITGYALQTKGFLKRYETRNKFYKKSGPKGYWDHCDNNNSYCSQSS